MSTRSIGSFKRQTISPLEDKLRYSRKALNRQVNKLFRHVFETAPFTNYQMEQVKATTTAINDIINDTFALFIYAIEITTSNNDISGKRRVYLGRVCYDDIDRAAQYIP